MGRLLHIYRPPSATRVLTGLKLCKMQNWPPGPLRGIIWCLHSPTVDHRAIQNGQGARTWWRRSWRGARRRGEPPCAAYACMALHLMPVAPRSTGPAHPAPQKRQFSGGDGGGQEAEKRARTDAWKTPQDIVTNGLFEEYYKEQGVCPPEVRRRRRCRCLLCRLPPAHKCLCALPPPVPPLLCHPSSLHHQNELTLSPAVQEWDAFILALKKPLPITFRINGQGKFADRLLERLEANFMQQFTEGPLEVGGRVGHGAELQKLGVSGCSRAQAFEPGRRSILFPAAPPTLVGPTARSVGACPTELCPPARPTAPAD